MNILLRMRLRVNKETFFYTFFCLLVFIFFSVWRGFFFNTMPSTGINISELGTSGIFDPKVLIPYGSASYENFLYRIGYHMIFQIIPDRILSSSVLYFFAFMLSYCCLLYLFAMLTQNKWLGLTITIIWFMNPLFNSQAGIQPLQMALLFLPLSLLCDFYLYQNCYSSIKTRSIKNSIFFFLISTISRLTLVLSSWYMAVIAGFTVSVFLFVYFLLKFKEQKSENIHYIVNVILLFLLPWIIAGVIGYILTPSGTSELSAPLDMFRGCGVDLITLFLPRGSAWTSTVFSYERWLNSQGLMLPGDSSMWNNYVGITLTVVSLVGLVKSKNKAFIACFCAGLICLVLAMGPGLKVFTAIPKTNSITYANYQLTEDQVILNFPWKNLFSIFPFSIMRATYRWIIATSVLLIISFAWCCKNVIRNKKLIGILCVIIILEVIPKPANINFSYGIENANYTRQISKSVADPLKKYNIEENDRVLFVDLNGDNDFLSSFISKEAGFRTYNGGGDKTNLLAGAFMPNEVRELRGIKQYSVDEEKILYNIQMLREKSLCEYVVIPLFSLRWGSYLNTIKDIPIDSESDIKYSESDIKYSESAERLVGYISENSTLNCVREQLFYIIDLKPSQPQIDNVVIPLTDFTDKTLDGYVATSSKGLANSQGLLLTQFSPLVLSRELAGDYEMLYLSFIYGHNMNESTSVAELQFLDQSRNLIRKYEVPLSNVSELAFYEGTWAIPDTCRSISLNISPEKGELVLDNLYVTQYNMDFVDNIPGIKLIRDIFFNTSLRVVSANNATYTDDAAIIFNPSTAITLSDENIISNPVSEYEMGMKLKIDDFVAETVDIVTKKGEGWPNEVTFVYGWNDQMVYVMLSENGTDVDGAWMPRDTLPEGEWCDIKIQFEERTLRYYVNEELIVERDCGLGALYGSSKPVVLGGNFTGSIKDFYIKYN